MSKCACSRHYENVEQMSAIFVQASAIELVHIAELVNYFYRDEGIKVCYSSITIVIPYKHAIGNSEYHGIEFSAVIDSVR